MALRVGFGGERLLARWAAVSDDRVSNLRGGSASPHESFPTLRGRGGAGRSGAERSGAGRGGWASVGSGRRCRVLAIEHQLWSGAGEDWHAPGSRCSPAPWALGSRQQCGAPPTLACGYPPHGRWATTVWRGSACPGMLDTLLSFAGTAGPFLLRPAPRRRSIPSSQARRRRREGAGEAAHGRKRISRPNQSHDQRRVPGAQRRSPDRRRVSRR
jgi:hypothetical protein